MKGRHVYLNQAEVETLMQASTSQIDMERDAQRCYPELAEKFRQYELAWISIRRKIRGRRKR